jgi:hypothetical protein
MPLQATSGAASYDAFGGGVPAAPNYIEDVFSTYLYTGTNAAQTITNGIDLSTKGGLVWFKNRSALTGAYAGFDRHVLFDNIRTGATNGGAGGGGVLRTNAAALDDATVTYLSSYNNNGVTIASNATVSNAEFINQSGTTFASWTWRKQPKYFDIQTWTGSGANRTISHALGSVPGCIIVKRTDATGDWQVYHRSLANTEYLVLNSTAAKATGATRWNSTTPTSTEFSLGTDATVNASAGTYVAYLFAHDAGGFGLTGTDNVISCGSFTTDGSGNATVNLGYEPQWVLLKNSSESGQNWSILDNMRGWTAGGGANLLDPNTSAAEVAYPSPTYDYWQLTSTGFKAAFTSGNANKTYIYIAIRRGPMKVPTTGTSVFAPVLTTNDAQPVVAGFPVDFFLEAQRSAPYTASYDRLRGSGQRLYTYATGAEASLGVTGTFASNTSVTPNEFGASSSIIVECFRRAPSFFDVVCYIGTGADQTIAHNLTVIPELIIVKSRSNASTDWLVKPEVNSAKYLYLNQTNAIAGPSTAIWSSSNQTASNFYVGVSAATGASGYTYVAYLFATCAGVSKVGSYTGNGTTQTIDCGFGAGGARFVLIKRTDSTGDWYTYDTARGMTVLTDPYLWLNSTNAEVATLGSVTTVSTGFALNSAILAAINVNAGTYIFLAIA